MFRVQTLPAFVIETFRVPAKMLIRKSVRFFYIFQREDLAGEIGLDDVLQPGHLRVIEEAAAGADVGVDIARVRRILPPVRELIAVGGEDGVEAQRLDVGSYWIAMKV